MSQLNARKCGDCEKLIPFQIFLRDNPSIPLERAKDIWEDPFIIPFCPECFLKIPEKPYKPRRRYNYNNHLRQRL